MSKQATGDPKQPEKSGKHDQDGYPQEKEGIPLSSIGEYQVPSEETLPEAPPNKKIHARRPLPLVPRAKPKIRRRPHQARDDAKKGS